MKKEIKQQAGVTALSQMRLFNNTNKEEAGTGLIDELMDDYSFEDESSDRYSAAADSSDE